MADQFTTRGTLAAPDGTAASALFNPALEARIRAAARAASVMSDKVITKFLPDPGPARHSFNVFTALTAAALTESADQDSSAVTTTATTLSADLVGLVVKINDQVALSAQPEFEPGAIMEMGRAVADKYDTDLLNLASGLSTNSVSNTGADLTLASFIQAKYKLTAQNAPEGNPSDPSSWGAPPSGVTGKVCVLDPWQVYDLQTAISVSSASWLMDASASRVLYENGQMSPGFAGTLLGVPVFQSTNVYTNAGDYTGMMFVPSAFGAVVKYLGRVERDRNVEVRTNIIAITSAYGVGELTDAFGCQLISATT